MPRKRRRTRGIRVKDVFRVKKHVFEIPLEAYQRAFVAERVTDYVTDAQIEAAREAYRPQASEGAMLYFLLTQLCAIEHMYQYSLDSFVTFFFKSIEKAVPAEKVDQPVDLTGAGDQFAAGFLSGVASGKPMGNAGRRGAVAAAEVIKHVGPRPQVNLQDLIKAANLA